MKKSITHAIPAPVTDPGLRNLHVLVVDDNETSRNNLCRQAADWGMRVGSADNCRTALEMMHESSAGGDSYEVALLDMMMPGMTGLELAGEIKSDPALEHVRIILLSYFGGHCDMHTEDDARIAAHLAKPVKRGELEKCLLRVLGKLPHAQSIIGTEENVSSRKAFAGLHGHILLVEDNTVNQMVARSMLEHLGITVDVSNNGIDAIDAFRRNAYDLILMDCQMPEMDGYSATRIIREKEASLEADPSPPRRQRHIPVIALTGHAMQGDSERCLAAGMDDYLTKPFGLSGLMDVLQRWLPSVSMANMPRAANNVESASRGGQACDSPTMEGKKESEEKDEEAPVFIEKVRRRLSGFKSMDREVLECLRSVLGDGQLDAVPQIIQGYLESSSGQMETLCEAIESGDTSVMKTTAHTLISSSGSLGAIRFSELCRVLQNLGLAENAEDALPLLPLLEAEYAGVREALEEELRCGGELRGNDVQPG